MVGNEMAMERGQSYVRVSVRLQVSDRCRIRRSFNSNIVNAFGVITSPDEARVLC